MKNAPLKISNITVQPGERITVALPTPQIYTCAPMYIPIHIMHGKNAGPTLLVCGAIHGDEINGVAITQKLLALRMLKGIRGTLIVIPSLNIYGMITLSRNLPDRRDLDGSFPGSDSGSFAARLARLITDEILTHITHCIDLHTGEPHISKFPQVKTSAENREAMELAHSFQAPVILDTKSEGGLLWLLHQEKKKIPTIVFETGEALRIDETGVKIGVKGIINVMRKMEMLSEKVKPTKARQPIEVASDQWVRTPSSGLCEVFCKMGAFVKKGQRLAKISDPFGTEQKEEITSPFDGVVIGKNHLPILNEGEPVLHIAEVKASFVEEIQKWSQRETSEAPLE